MKRKTINHSLPLLVMLLLCLSSGLQAAPGNLLNDSISISGKVTFVTGMPMEGVAVYINAGTLSDTTFTDEDGNYIFSDLPTGVTYILDFHKYEAANKGVTTEDMYYTRQYLLYLDVDEMLPYNILSMDYNGSGAVTTFDLVEAGKTIEGITIGFDRWRFVSSYQSFPNPQNPLQTVFPSTPAIQTTTGSIDIENVDMTGYKLGDVNQDVDFND